MFTVICMLLKLLGSGQILFGSICLYVCAIEVVGKQANIVLKHLFICVLLMLLGNGQILFVCFFSKLLGNW